LFVGQAGPQGKFRDDDLVVGADLRRDGDLLAIDECPVGRVEIEEHHASGLYLQARVGPGDVLTPEDEVAVELATDHDLSLCKGMKLRLPIRVDDLYAEHGDLGHLRPLVLRRESSKFQIG